MSNLGKALKKGAGLKGKWERKQGENKEQRRFVCKCSPSDVGVRLESKEDGKEGQGRRVKKGLFRIACLWEFLRGNIHKKNCRKV